MAMVAVAAVLPRPARLLAVAMLVVLAAVLMALAWVVPVVLVGTTNTLINKSR